MALLSNETIRYHSSMGYIRNKQALCFHKDKKAGYLVNLFSFFFSFLLLKIDLIEI